MDIEEITIAQIHENYRRGVWTSQGLVRAYLDRIEQLDRNGPCINSTMAMSITALDEAAALDEFFVSNAAFKGSLHGIPVLLKDQADTAGIETMYGSKACKNNIPDTDAVAVQKLKAAGAIILGKTTMSEWATSWFSVSSATDWKFTNNPYKPGYEVGGSSSGSAAAVAANFTVLALGEDTGGSIRLPSSYCNIVGLRCTPGLISRTGFCPLVKTMDTPGPMARTVQDCALMMDCLVGYDPEDEYTVAAISAGHPKGGSYAAHLDPKAITKARIGIVRSLFGPEDDPYCSAVNGVITTALETLEKAGTTFVDVEIPNVQAYIFETLTYITRSRADVNSFLATKPNLPDDIVEIVPEQPPHPTLAGTCAIMNGPKDPLSDKGYAQRLLLRDEFQRLITGIMAHQQLDALAFPDVRIPPPAHADATNGRFPDVFQFPTNTLLASQARIPGISVPVGFTADGLPVGMELVSWEYREQTLFELACGVEATIQARRAPKLA